jgi:hypothetical protein
MLQQYVATILPQLVLDGLWEIQVAERWAALLVWQKPEKSYVAGILEGLSTVTPESENLSELMSELEIRLGADESADKCELPFMDTEGEDLHWLAEQLNSSISVVGGANLLADSDWYVLDMADGHYWDRGLYFLDHDSGGTQIKGCAWRIDGVWNQDLPEHPGAWAGFQLWDYSSGKPRQIRLEERTVYLLAWSYKAGRLDDGRPNVWLGIGVTEASGLKTSYSMKDTAGHWRRRRILFAVDEEQLELEFAVRLLGVGSAWFSDFTLSPLYSVDDESIDSLMKMPIYADVVIK